MLPLSQTHFLVSDIFFAVVVAACKGGGGNNYNAQLSRPQNLLTHDCLYKLIVFFHTKTICETA